MPTSASKDPMRLALVSGISVTFSVLLTLELGPPSSSVMVTVTVWLEASSA